LAVVTSVVATILLALSIGAVAATAGSNPPSSPLVLQQLLNGQVQCVSNDATCTAVNLYGQNGNPNSPNLNPNGETRTTSVQLLNAGSQAASNLTLTPGACVNQDLSGTPVDLCSIISVGVSCSTAGSDVSFGPLSLTAFGRLGTQIVDPGLAPNASTTCTFTVVFPPGSPASALATRAVQPVTWTLLSSETPTPTPTPTAPGTPAPGVPAPGVPAPSAVPGPLAVTGSNPIVLALAGLALLVAGRVLARAARRRQRSEADESVSAV
jgi:hypothetical protein